MRYRFGLKELLFVVFGSGLTVLVGNIDFGISAGIHRIFQPEAVIAASFALISGPIVGGLIGFIGYIAMRLVSHQVYYWGWALANLIVGLGIGLYSGSFHVRDGEFRGKNIALFVMIQLIAEAIGFMLVYPLSEVLLYQISIQDGMRIGTMTFLLNSLVVCVGAGLFGMIYSMCVRVKKRNVKKQDDK